MFRIHLILSPASTRRASHTTRQSTPKKIYLKCYTLPSSSSPSFFSPFVTSGESWQNHYCTLSASSRPLWSLSYRKLWASGLSSSPSAFSTQHSTATAICLGAYWTPWGYRMSLSARKWNLLQDSCSLIRSSCVSIWIFIRRWSN